LGFGFFFFFFGTSLRKESEAYIIFIGWEKSENPNWLRFLCPILRWKILLALPTMLKAKDQAKISTRFSLLNFYSAVL